MRFVLASNNSGKLREIKAILETLGIDIYLMADLGLNIEVEETEPTFEGNALLKARAVMDASGLPALADDSGLCVDALDGMPGVYSHRWGNLSSDEERNAYLLQKLTGVPVAQRTARYVSVIACCTPDGKVFSVRGECEGHILEAPRGENGFGYDPLFYCDAIGKTFAEAFPKEKDLVSHRRNALNAFVATWKDHT